MTAQELAQLTAEAHGFCWMADNDEGNFVVSTSYDTVDLFCNRYGTQAELIAGPGFDQDAAVAS